MKYLGVKAPEFGCCLPEECSCRAYHLERALIEAAEELEKMCFWDESQNCEHYQLARKLRVSAGEVKK